MQSISRMLLTLAEQNGSSVMGMKSVAFRIHLMYPSWLVATAVQLSTARVPKVTLFGDSGKLAIFTLPEVAL